MSPWTCSVACVVVDDEGVVSLRTARALTGTYFVLMLVFVTWPGLVPFARVRPLILGLPFSMAWIGAWIAGSVVVLYLLDGVEKRHRDERGHRPVGPTDSRAPGGAPPPAGSRPDDDATPSSSSRSDGRRHHRPHGGA